MEEIEDFAHENKDYLKKYLEFKNGYCLGQKAIDEKRNEITAIPELLETIEIKGQMAQSTQALERANKYRDGRKNHL
ncbi:MAG: hypothetical protein RR310_02000 [Eubacterium sp.]